MFTWIVTVTMVCVFVPFFILLPPNIVRKGIVFPGCPSAAFIHLSVLFVHLFVQIDFVTMILHEQLEEF